MSGPNPNMDARQRIRQAVPWVEEQRGRVRLPLPPGESVEPVFVRPTGPVSTTLIPPHFFDDPDYHAYPGKVTFWNAGTVEWEDMEADIVILPANRERLIEGVRYDARHCGIASTSGAIVFVTVPGPPVIWANIAISGYTSGGAGYDGANGVTYTFSEVYWDTATFRWAPLTNGRTGVCYEVRNRQGPNSDYMDAALGGYAVVQLTLDGKGNYIFKSSTVIVPTHPSSSSLTTPHTTKIDFGIEFNVYGGEAVTVEGAGITGSYP